MPKIIGIDCDEVLSNTMDQLLQTRYAQERHLQREDITSYNLWEIPKFDLSREEAKDFFFWFFDSEEFWKVKPVLGAREKLEQRKAEGHRLLVITGRAISFRDITMERVHQYFPNLFDDFLFSSALTDQEVSKSELCKQAGIQVIVEDNLDFVADLSQHWVPCFLLDKPRNQNYTAQNYPNVIKVPSRNEIDLSLLS